MCGTLSSDYFIFSILKSLHWVELECSCDLQDLDKLKQHSVCDPRL